MLGPLTVHSSCMPLLFPFPDWKLLCYQEDPSEYFLRSAGKKIQVFKVFLQGTQTLLYEAWPRGQAVRTGLTFVSSLVFCTNTRTLGKTVYFSHDPSETVRTTPCKERPKVTIVAVIFLVCIVRLDQPVIDPQMKDLEELLVATSFPLNSTS